jgi:poly(3-hydroxybutyrate) depolymerase
MRNDGFRVRLLGVGCVLALVTAGLPAVAMADTSAGCGLTAPSPPGQSKNLALAYGGLDRGYRLHLPGGYDVSAPTPLVVSIHGYYSSGLTNENFTDLSSSADTNGFVVVYPESTSFNAPGWGNIKSWNDLACNASPGPEGPTCAENADVYPCPPECGSCGDCNWCSCHDDLGFVNAVIDELEATLCVDLDRVYLVGYSNGGMFAHQTACELSDRLAAVIPQHGFLAKGFSCVPPTDHQSLLLIGGTSDNTVPFDGSRSSDGYFYTPMAQVASEFAAAQGCSPTTSPYVTPSDGVDNLDCVQHADCTTGAEVVRCEWNGAHDYPSWGNEDVFWPFLEANAMPVPEPGATLQLVAGISMLAYLRRRR